MQASTQPQKPFDPLQCPVCHRTFSRKDNLRTHQRLHTGEKPFLCKYCAQPFRWAGALHTHENLHLRGRAKPFKFRPPPKPTPKPTPTPPKRPRPTPTTTTTPTPLPPPPPTQQSYPLLPPLTFPSPQPRYRLPPVSQLSSHAPPIPAPPRPFTPASLPSIHPHSSSSSSSSTPPNPRIIRVREIDKGDAVRGVLDLLIRGGAPMIPEARFPHVLDEHRAAGSRVTVVAEVAGRVVAMGAVVLGVRFVHGGIMVGQVEDVVVEGGGDDVLKSLIDKLVKEAWARGCRKVVADWEPEREHVYISCGFERERKWMVMYLGEGGGV